MGQLYDITERYKNLLDLAENTDIDKKMIIEALKGVDEELSTKADNIGRLYKNLGASIKVLKEEETRLQKRRKTFEKNQTNLKAYLKDCMRQIGKTKIKTDLFNFNLQANTPALMIEDEKNIPEEFFYNEKILDKTLLKEKLKEGLEITGASLKQSESLRIR